MRSLAPLLLLALAGCGNRPSANPGDGGVSASPDLTTSGGGPAAWPMVGHDARRSGQSSNAGPLGGAVRWSVLLPTVPEHLVIDGDGGLFALSGRKLLAIRPTDGTVLWNKDMPGETVATERGPAIGIDGTIVAATTDGEPLLVGIDPRTGTRRWIYRPIRFVTHPIAIAGDGDILIADDQYSLARLTPTGLLRARVDANPSTTLLISYIGVSLDGDVPVVTTTKTVCRYGAMTWCHTAAQHFDRQASIGPDGTVYAVDTDQLLALDAADGTVRWSAPVHSSEIAPMRDGKVLVYRRPTDGDAQLLALLPGGAIGWTAPGKSLGATAYYGSPAVDDDGNSYVFATDPSIAVGDDSAMVVALDAGGHLLWKSDKPRYGAFLPGSLTLGVDRTLHAVTSDGRLLAIGP